MGVGGFQTRARHPCRLPDRNGGARVGSPVRADAKGDRRLHGGGGTAGRKDSRISSWRPFVRASRRRRNCARARSRAFCRTCPTSRVFSSRNVPCIVKPSEVWVWGTEKSA